MRVSFLTTAVEVDGPLLPAPEPAPASGARGALISEMRKGVGWVVGWLVGAVFGRGRWGRGSCLRGRSVNGTRRDDAMGREVNESRKCVGGNRSEALAHTFSPSVRAPYHQHPRTTSKGH
jgi:hypothetical protein